MNFLIPPYEERLAERPQDIPEFNDLVVFLIARCQPGGFYRLPLFGRWKRRVFRENWEKIVRSHMGLAYELGRR